MIGAPAYDLAIIIVCHNARDVIATALRSVTGSVGALRYQLIVVDNGEDGTGALVEASFPDALVIRCPNRGFAHGNNVALRLADARYALFLNPDTEVLDGSLESLVSRCDQDPALGVAGVTQVSSTGTRAATVRRFPSVGRALAEALGAERWIAPFNRLGERELSDEIFERESDCDWVSGSFMLIRREALLSAGWFDERFFLYSEETDLCLRIRMAGWGVRHFPVMRVVHHEGSRVEAPELEGQLVFSRLQYAAKHFRGLRQLLYRSALILRYGLRVALVRPRKSSQAADLRLVWAAGLRAAISAEAPLQAPPAVALEPARRQGGGETDPGHRASTRGGQSIAPPV